MSTDINVHNNNGIISTGNNARNIITSNHTDDINWVKLNKELDALKSSPDSSIRKFAEEAAEASKKKDKRGISEVLSKWIPCIGSLIESSYYIIEIAKNFNIGF